MELKKIFETRGWDWNEYKKFTIVRNPYDRVVSLWHHYQWMYDEGYVTTQYESFHAYVRSISTNKRLTTSLNRFIGDEDGHELVEDVLQYEHMNEELPKYLLSLNIHIDTIPHLNRSLNRVDYTDYYDEDTIEIVTKLYKDEIEKYSYVFKEGKSVEKNRKIVDNDTLHGKNGGAWDEKTHLQLHPKNFNFGLADFIVSSIKPKSVLEFGSGLGFLSRHIVDTMSLSDVYCIEPNEIEGIYDNINGPKLLSLDIFNQNHPFVLNRKFDLVMSIEVAEHIPREQHNELFDFLVSHTNNWIVFSGARIGQGGHGHIAERTEEEWKSEFLKRGMLFQDELTQSIRLACDEKNINHRQNLMVFKRPVGYEKLDEIEKEARPYTQDILAIVQENSNYLDGNLFYVNMQDAINGMPADNLKEKRRNLVSIMQERTNVLEVGFNAGHSALIMLLVNNDVMLTVIDICQHPYTESCFDYLTMLFPNRLKLIKGDSTVVMHELKGEKFDLIHYDGGKEKTILQDLKNSVQLVADDHILLIDDTQNSRLEEIIKELEKEKFIELNKYRVLSQRTDNYKWRHAIATFSDKDQHILTETVLQKLQKLYDHAEFVSIYTNNIDVKQISGFARADSLVEIFRRVNLNNISGDFVECGVAAGHSSVIAALASMELNDDEIKFYLYDTYNGFDFPLSDEKDTYNKSIKDYDLSRYQSIHTSVAAVFDKLVHTGLQPARIKMIKGMVEDTIPKYLPEKISILRLDVDLYHPTLHCLREMFPLLQKGGYLIIDDYGHWEGCKRAVHEFFEEEGLSIDNLEYIDYTCRVYRK